MHGHCIVVVLVGVLAGCSGAVDDAVYLVHGAPPADPARLVFGVAGDRPAGGADAAADAEMRSFLDIKAGQICTRDYAPAKVDTLAAEEDRQFVGEELRCKPYAFGLY
jgi:hypothetical protein